MLQFKNNVKSVKKVLKIAQTGFDIMHACVYLCKRNGELFVQNNRTIHISKSHTPIKKNQEIIWKIGKGDRKETA